MYPLVGAGKCLGAGRGYWPWATCLLCLAAPRVTLCRLNAHPVPIVQRLMCPREVVWLNGAPGSGKGARRLVGAPVDSCSWSLPCMQPADGNMSQLARRLRCHNDCRPCQLPPLLCAPTRLPAGTNMPFIMKSRGLSRAIGMSQLLDTSPDIKVKKRRGAGWMQGVTKRELNACGGGSLR